MQTIENTYILNKIKIFLNLECVYTSNIVKLCIQNRSNVELIDQQQFDNDDTNDQIIQIADFENIAWEKVMQGVQKANSYLVRKGLSRKAQLSFQIKRFLSKNPNSILKTAIPFTLKIETWNAFEDMQLDFGGGTIANFGDIQAPLRQRLDWCLDDIKEEFEQKPDWIWILKPSYTNKGNSISMINSWDGILDSLEETNDIREWVLQKYIPNPLLVRGYKFHLRVYVMCVGALKVYVFEQILMLLASHKYQLDDISDIYRHLTNTAKGAENIDFDEKKFVKLLDDLPQAILNRGYVCNLPQAIEKCDQIRKDIRTITCELFKAFENEYTVFAPMSNCFEMYGLDFMIDTDFNVSLLEVNPGPDFKQTGDRLSSLIKDLWEQAFSLVIDQSQDKNTYKDFTKVYDKEWSAQQSKGGMKFQE